MASPGNGNDPASTATAAVAEQQPYEVNTVDETLEELIEVLQSKSTSSFWFGGEKNGNSAAKVARLLNNLRPDQLQATAATIAEDNNEAKALSQHHCRTRLERLLECCVLDRSTAGDVWIATTGIMISVNAGETHPNVFDRFVRSIWKLVGPETVNDADTCDLRYTACYCLREIELAIPQALEALVHVKDGEDTSLLERCVVEERSHAYQAYLTLYLTILANKEPITERERSTELSAVSLVIESLGLLSLNARLDVIDLASRLLGNDKSMRIFLAHHVTDSLGFQSSAAAFGLLFDLSSRLSWWEDETHLALVDRLSARAVRDWTLPIKTREYICKLRRDISNLGVRLSPALASPSAFDDVNVQLYCAETAVAATVHASSFSNPLSTPFSVDLIVSICWFIDEFYRERRPGVLKETVYSLFRAILKVTKEEDAVVAKICEHLTQGAALRGGSRFFHPLKDVLNLSERERSRTKIICRVADAIADVPNPLDTIGFFPIIQMALIIDAENIRHDSFDNGLSRVLAALDRFVTHFHYLSEERWDDAMGYLDCCRCAFLSAHMRLDQKAYQFIVRLVEKLQRIRPQDVVLADECDQLLRLAHVMVVDNIPFAQEIMMPSQLPFVATDTKVAESESDALTPMVKATIRTVDLASFLTLERVAVQTHGEENVSSFSLSLRLQWGDAGNNEEMTNDDLKELYSMEIHVIDYANPDSAAFERCVEPLVVPYMSKDVPVALLTLWLVPKFPGPCRLSFRALASDTHGNLVEGQLQDVFLTIQDWFIPFRQPASDIPFTDRVVIVRENITNNALETFLTKTFSMHPTFSSDGEPHETVKNQEWDISVSLKPRYHLRFLMKYKAEKQRFEAEVFTDHWVLMSYLDALFKIA